MTKIKNIELTEGQREKLEHLILSLFPTVNVAIGERFAVFLEADKEPTMVHWFELCFNILAEGAAEIYIRHHIDCTLSWAKRMILQKLAHELHEHNPIDTLYSLCENPNGYAQTL